MWYLQNKRNMWNALRLLTGFLCAQHCVGQISYRVVPAVNHDGLHQSFPESTNHDLTLQQASTVVNTGAYGFGQEATLPDKRELQDGTICVLIVTLWIANRGRDWLETTQIVIVFTITDAGGTETTYTKTVEIAISGQVITELAITSASLLNAAGTGICDDCTLVGAGGECISGDCANYLASDNAVVYIESSVCGDPHMVGLLGQKIDWAGEDGGWYCLIFDGEDFQLNVRVTAPMPEEFPDRQLVSGVSLLLPNDHSLVVEVKNPYTIETGGCGGNTSSPCLADGALRILVDNEEAPDLQIPGEKVMLAEGVHVSATNLPAECRPFGGDRIWAAQFEKMMAATRSLGEVSITLEQWVVQPGTLAAPTWCAKYLEDGVSELLSTQSNHATLRLETPAVDLRLNIGINHQELVVDAEGSTVVPELEFWQTDIGLERHHFPNTVGGMLGETSRFVLDSNGNPIREGLEALHGPVESYRVVDALGVDFERLNRKW